MTCSRTEMGASRILVLRASGQPEASACAGPISAEPQPSHTDPEHQDADLWRGSGKDHKGVPGHFGVMAVYPLVTVTVSLILIIYMSKLPMNRSTEFYSLKRLYKNSSQSTFKGPRGWVPGVMKHTRWLGTSVVVFKCLLSVTCFLEG